MKKIFFVIILFSACAPDLRKLSKTDPAEAMLQAQRYESSARLRSRIFDVYTLSGGDPQWGFVYGVFEDLPVAEKMHVSGQFGNFIGHVRNASYARQGIIALAQLRAAGVLKLVKANRLLLRDTASASLADSVINSIEAVNSAIYIKGFGGNFAVWNRNYLYHHLRWKQLPGKYSLLKTPGTARTL